MKEKSKGFRRGFTLIEIVLVVALIAMLGTASVVFAAPAIGQFACQEEARAAMSAVERARHASQFLRHGHVRLEITSDGYLVRALGNDGDDPILVDQFEHRSPVQVVANRDLVFLQNVGAPVQDVGQILIGDEWSLCQQIININNAGAIF